MEGSRKDEEDDDDNGDQAPCRACEKQPYRSAIAPWKPESVSNHRGRVSLCRAPVLRLVSLPLSLSRPRSPRVLRAIAFRFLAPRHDDVASAGIRVDSRQDYSVNNAPNSPGDLSCIIAKLFRSHFQSARVFLFDFFDSLSLPLSSSEKTSSFTRCSK